MNNPIIVDQNNLQGGDKFEIFNYNNLGSVRVQIDNQGNPWFCLSDICTILGLSNPAKVSSRLFSEGITLTHTLTNGGTQNLIFIDEGNLYKAIMGSRKPEAEAFQKWICFEVIPSIRKTGSYNSQNNLTFKDFMFKLAGQVDQNVSDIKSLFTITDRNTQAINDNIQRINVLNEKAGIISDLIFLN